MGMLVPDKFVAPRFESCCWEKENYHIQARLSYIQHKKLDLLYICGLIHVK